MEIVLGLVWLVMVGIGIGFAVFWLMMLIHCLKSESESKLMWFFVIIFLNGLGALLYRFIEYPKLRAQDSAVA